MAHISSDQKQEDDVGISVGVSGCSCSRIVYKYEPMFPNPNPNNYKIKQTKQVGKYVVAEIIYPDCTNYEGSKILVFENIMVAKLYEVKSLDPHFCENGCLSPVARFEPTKKGWALAIKMCEACK